MPEPGSHGPTATSSSRSPTAPADYLRRRFALSLTQHPAPTLAAALSASTITATLATTMCIATAVAATDLAATTALAAGPLPSSPLPLSEHCHIMQRDRTMLADPRLGVGDE